MDGITAVTVMRSGADYMLCPFFGKCDGLLTVSTGTIAVRFIPNPLRSAGSCRRLSNNGLRRRALTCVSALALAE